MKILVAYASKHGFTKDCTEKLSEKLNGEVEIKNLKLDKAIDLSQYDKVIIGGSIYAGQIQKEVKNFCAKNINELKSKKLGLFICGMNDDDKASQQINASYPQELLNCAIAKENFGGEFIFSKMNFFERFIIKKIAKTDKDLRNLKEDNILSFVEKMNK